MRTSERGADAPWRRAERIGCWLGCSLLLTLTACNDLLTVNNPDVVRPENLASPEGLRARRAGAFGDFALAYGGDGSQVVVAASVTGGQILASGLLADEYKNTGNPGGSLSELDARRILDNNGDVVLLYAELHRAREAAEETADAYRAASEAAAVDATLAEMLNLAGFTYTFFGEDFCSGVPVSRVTETGDVEYGPPLTTEELFNRSVERFDSAMARAQAAGNATLQYLAQVGKGRALLDLAQFPQAASAVGGVPTGFSYAIRYSTNTPRQENGTYLANNVIEWWSVINHEAGNGVDFLDVFTQGDPRTPWVVAPDSTGFDKTAGVQYDQQLYPAANASIPLATGVEARLIEAEAALQVGDTASFAGIHNALRATLNAPAVGAISADTMSFDEQVDFQFRERALWLWLTGHRLGDLRRLVRQYGRSADSVFPSGPYFKAVYPTYGTDTNFPVPFTETNNPHFAGCLDRNP